MSMADKKGPELKKSLELLYEVSQLVISDRYLEETLAKIVELTAGIMDSKICSLMILDEKKQTLAIKAAQSLSPAYKNKPPVKVKESVIGRAVLYKEPVIIEDVKQDPGYQYPDIAQKENLCSLVTVPMVAKGKVIGVLNCYTTERRIFDQEEIRILGSVANQAALAVENARLLAEKVNAIEALETRKKVERAKALLMKRHQFSEEDAFRRLQKQSMDKRVSLKEIAEAVILSEEVAKN